MVLWCYPFLRDLDGEARRERGDPQPGTLKTASNAVLAILFFLLVSISWRLPDPYWLVSMLGFMPLLPAVAEIKGLNGPGSYHIRRNSKLVLRHYALMILIFPLVALVIAQSMGLIPSPYVIAGTELSERQTRMIRELAALGDDERIDFYYADGFLSYEEDGNVVTDQRVVSYFRDEAGVDNLASAPYEEISSLHVHFGTFFEPTLILVCLGNKESFLLYAGTEEKKDRRFVYTIKNRLRHGAPYIVEEHDDFACETQTGA